VIDTVPGDGTVVVLIAGTSTPQRDHLGKWYLVEAASRHGRRMGLQNDTYFSRSNLCKKLKAACRPTGFTCSPDVLAELLVVAES
jgi:hypothetical protein